VRKWVSVKVRSPDSEIECFLAKRDGRSLVTHKKLAEWDGKEWVDIDGETVEGVEWWMEAPTSAPLNALEKINGCISNDKCEKMDCCYFTAGKEIETLMEYINE